ncbi:MAG TPA: zinc-binding dehydrogenase [Brumimicrobium sp.]|nr:zinc-binding dehydrogenase [Brumimicrobium sp.]
MSKLAIQLVKYGPAETAFNFTEATPIPLEHDEVEIAVERFGINYADVMARNGLYREAPPLPCVLGYEVVGEVTKIGKDSPKELLGKRVVAFARFGGYSQVVNTKYYAVAPIADLDGNKALCLATQYVTAYYMSEIALYINEGDNILIHAAAGGVGTALIQLMKSKNVNIIAKVGSDNKIAHLKSMGIKHIVNYNKNDYVVEVQAILGDEKLDVSFNPVGGSSFKKDWKLIGPTGKLLLYGGSERSGKKWGILSDLNFVRKMGILIPIGLMGTSKSVIGVNMLRVSEMKPLLLKKCLDAVVALAIKEEIQPHVDKVFKATEIAAAHAYLESGKSVGKVVLEW